MRDVIGAVLVWAAALAAPAGALAQTWTGALGPAADSLPLALRVDGETVTAEFPSLAQAGYEGRVARGADGTVSMTVETPAGPLILNGQGDGTLTGTWKFLGREGAFELAKAAAQAPAWREEPFSFRGADGVTLSGVVLVPPGKGRRPALVGVHGSGVETRAGGNRYLAEQLVRKGAVVLLFDKRGTGRSEGDWKGATLQQLAGDVTAALDVLAARKDVDPGRLGLMGPSQAGWVAAIAAAERPCVRHLVMRSAVLTGVAEEGRYDYLVRVKDQPAEVQARARRILELDDEVTRSGRGWDALQAEVAAASDTPWFKAMKFKLAPADDPARARYRPWLDFDPRPLLEQSRAAGLWIYAGHDETAPAERSAEIARELAAKGHDYQVLTLADASHALYVAAPGKSWPQVAPEYLSTTLDWWRRHADDAPLKGCAARR